MKNFLQCAKLWVRAALFLGVALVVILETGEWLPNLSAALMLVVVILMTTCILLSGRKNATLGLGGLALYFLSWPVTDYYGIMIALLVVLPGMVMYFESSVRSFGASLFRPV